MDLGGGGDGRRARADRGGVERPNGGLEAGTARRDRLRVAPPGEIAFAVRTRSRSWTFRGIAVRPLAGLG